MITKSRPLHIGRLCVQLVACSMVAFTVNVSAQDAKSLTVGAPIKDGLLKIGWRTFQLPPGTWIFAGRHEREVKLTEVRSGAQVIETYAAMAQDGKLRAGIMLTGTLAGTRLSSWAEDPSCRPGKSLYRETGDSPTHSDCLVVRVAPSHPTQVQGALVYEEAAKWMQAEGIKTPRPVFTVLIVKYQGDEYIRTSAWLDPAEFGIKSEDAAGLTAAPDSLVQWAKQYRAVIAGAMNSNSGTFALPALPSPAR